MEKMIHEGRACIVFAINEDCNAMIYCRMFPYPEQEKEAQEAFQYFSAYSEYESYMCTSERFAEILQAGLQSTRPR